MGHQALLVIALVIVLTTMGNERVGITMASGAAEGAHHVAGDDQGWDAASNIAAWSVGRIFRVGDTIWFAYSVARESVAELRSREEFESCDITDPIKMYDGGVDRVRLDAKGDRYFASGNPGSCRNGLKLRVEVLPQATAGETTATVASDKSSAVAQVAAAGPEGPSGCQGLFAPSLMLVVLVIFSVLWAYKGFE